MPTGFDWVALYAAVLATSSFLFGVYQYVSGRKRKLEVEVRVSTVLRGAVTTRVIGFRARNTGTLPIRVTQCGLASTRRRLFRAVLDEMCALPLPSYDLGSPTFPSDVEPHQTFSCYAGLATWCRGLPEGHVWRDFDRVYFVDGIGRRHVAKIPEATLAELECECAKTTAQGEKAR